MADYLMTALIVGGALLVVGVLAYVSHALMWGAILSNLACAVQEIKKREPPK